jgi:hypothetical protein
MNNNAHKSAQNNTSVIIKMLECNYHRRLVFENMMALMFSKRQELDVDTEHLLVIYEV